MRKHGGQVAPFSAWLLTTILLGLSAWWLLSGPPPVADPGSIMFESPGAEAHLEVTLVDETNGDRSVTFRNAQNIDTRVIVDLALPGGIPSTLELGAISNTPGMIPMITTSTSSRTVCSWFQGRGHCTFELSGRAGRSFVWNSDGTTWFSQQGARWAALTPFIRPSNTSVGLEDDFVNSVALDVRVLLPLPAASQVIAGPGATWDYNNAVQVFQYSGSGQVAAPLIYDSASRPLEEFALFLLAVLLGVSVERVVRGFGVRPQRHEPGPGLRWHRIRVRQASSTREPARTSTSESRYGSTHDR